MKIANLCKPIHDVIIIVVSSDSLNVETLKGKGENYKKLNILGAHKELFR